MYCYGCLYNAYTWKNQVYLSVITLVCELWVVWSLWICWESGFSCVICGPLAVCFLSTTKKKKFIWKQTTYLACCLFWLVVIFSMSICKQTTYFKQTTEFKQTTYFNCRELTSHFTLKFMLGDVLWRTQPLNM